jgi:hypothetical protein
MTDHDLTIRVARPQDTPALRRLAQLDSTRLPRGHVLLAEAGGVPVAAISVYTGAVTADPFHHTAAAVHLLRRRRYQLLRQGGDAAPARHVLRRLASDPGH